MNSRSLYFSPVIGLLAGWLSTGAESLQFSFQDNLSEEFGVNYAFGDVVNGVVVMDTDSGAFSVTWNLVGGGFLSPVHLNLHMINNAIENENEKMITIMGSYPGGYDISSITFKSDQLGPLDTAILSNWAPGQEITTSGSVGGLDYVSGAYSKDWMTNELVLSDAVEFTGILTGDPLAVPPQEDPPELVDIDSDGIDDSVDEWTFSDKSETVFLLGINTWIPNKVHGMSVSETGHTLADIIQLLEMAASKDAWNHGQYVQELVRNYKMLVKDDLITQQEYMTLVRIVVEYGK